MHALGREIYSCDDCGVWRSIPAPSIQPQAGRRAPTPPWGSPPDDDPSRRKTDEILFDIESAPERPRCTVCDVELSKELDAYFGHDPIEATQCVKCRRKNRP